MAEEQCLAWKRAVSLVFACFVVIVAGTISTFANFATNMKNEFEQSQPAVEVIGAIGNIGAGLGYPAGLFCERFGNARTFIFAMLLNGSSAILLYTTQFATKFYHTYWILLALYWFIFGFGTSIMCLAPTSVCAQNFSGRVRGVIIGLTQSCHMLGPALFGQIYASWFVEGPIGNYFLFVAITCVAMNLFSIWILRPIPAYSGNDGEQVRLLESHTVSFIDDNDSPSSGWMECVGLDLMKIPAFHLISWCFLLPVSLQLVVFTNITTMAASLGFDKLGIMLPIWGPVAAFIIGLTSGFISDLTVKHMSRVFYATVGNSLQTLFFILSIFWGDTPSIFTGLVIVSYINNGFLFATIPTLSSEYFGTHHFMRNWGAETFTSAVLSFILGLVLGGFYQNAITNGGTECYGLICFETMFIIGSVLSAFSVLLCGMMWHVEHIKARQRGYERTN